MKKLFVYGLSVALVAGAASCKKSSKGKMDNEWKLSAMTQTSSSTSGGSTTSSTTTIADGAITITDVDANGDKDITAGTITTATWTISKDGTWTRTFDMAITSYTPAGGTATPITGVTQKMTDSGTWDFLGGVTGDFKKNERVVFTTLSSTSSQTFSGSTDTNTNTYAEGEETEVMVITESSKKELIMTTAEANTSTNTPQGGTATTSSNTGSSTFTLIQE